MMGPSSMRCSLLVVAMVLAYGVAAVAQGPTFKLGRTPTEQELRPTDAAVGPDGKGLPPGSGTAEAGATIYVARGCAKCHGPTGDGRPGPTPARTSGRKHASGHREQPVCATDLELHQSDDAARPATSACVAKTFLEFSLGHVSNAGLSQPGRGV